MDKLSIFISYTHSDIDFVEKFNRFLAPTNDKFEVWYDKKISAGTEFNEDITNHLKDAQIICLFISVNYLNSKSCKEEVNMAFELKAKKNIRIIPIIVSTCSWKDDSRFSDILALPTDGKPLNTFEGQESDICYTNVGSKIKEVVDEIRELENIIVSDKFRSSFLNNAEAISEFSNNKKNVDLQDVFVYPDFTKYLNILDSPNSEGNNGCVNSEEIIDHFTDFSKIVISGEDQSGKTTLCKILFSKLKKAGLIPIYLIHQNYYGNLDKKLKENFQSQYNTTIKFEDIDKNYIVPIIDDFHNTLDKDKLISQISIYRNQILVVDDIYPLNVNSDDLIKDYSYFKINSFKSTKRKELIKKWLLSENNFANDKEMYHQLDIFSKLLDDKMGQSIGKKIIPSYPFFIFSIIYSLNGLKDKDNLASIGDCYNALIVVSLMKNNVTPEELNYYHNFLKKFAYKIFLENKEYLSEDEFTEFLENYSSEYNLLENFPNFLDKLKDTKLIKCDDLNNYKFCYKYIYYFYIAQYFSENFSPEDNEIKSQIDGIVDNVYKTDNAYILIFLFYHDNYNLKYVLNKIKEKTKLQFSDVPEAVLNKDELKFLEENDGSIVKLSLSNLSAEKTRSNISKIEDKIEDQTDNVQEESIENENNSVRLAIRLTEVIGQIMKNKSGSFSKEILSDLFENSFDLNMRLISAFLTTVKSKEEEEKLIKFILSRLNKINEKKGYSSEKLSELSRDIYFKFVFFVIHGTLIKMISSIGSRKLIKIESDVCDSKNTSASLLVKYITKIRYESIDINEINKYIREANLSEVVKAILINEVIYYMSIYPIKHAERNRIQSLLKIPQKRLPLPHIS